MGATTSPDNTNSSVAQKASDRSSGGTPWESRRALATAVRIAIAVVPLISSIIVILVVGRIWVQPTGAMKAVWWLAMCGVSTGLYYAVERVTRRFLPLASLLKLTLIFPDEAPSRFSMALRSGNTKHLQKTIEEFKTGQIPLDIGQRAIQVLELATAVNEHDRGTRGHSERVRAYTEMIAIEMGLSDDRIERLRWAALLHDVGKLYVPSSILNKAGRPSEAEWNVIKGHPILGEHLVEPLTKFLGDALTATGQHHEKWDGTGYPRGLKGTEIGWAARIVAVADSYAVMTAARSYKKPMSDAAARAELAKCAGTQFDPTVVRAMLNLSMGRRRPLAGVFAPLVNLVNFGAAGATTSVTTVAAGASLSMGVVAAATTSDISAFAIPTKDDQANHAAEVLDEQVSPDLGEPTTTVITVAAAAISSSTTPAVGGSHEAHVDEPATTIAGTAAVEAAATTVRSGAETAATAPGHTKNEESATTVHGTTPTTSAATTTRSAATTTRAAATTTTTTPTTVAPTTTVAALVAPPTVQFSHASNLSGPQPLSAAGVSGRIYIFLSPTTGVTRARFRLYDDDDHQLESSDDRCAPFLLFGETSCGSSPRALDTSELDDGTYLVKVTYYTSGGSTTLEVPFNVD